MLLKPKDKLDKYHGDCSYEKSGSVTPYTEISLPVEVMDLSMVHFRHSIFCRRHKRGARDFGHFVQGDCFLFFKAYLSNSHWKLGNFSC